MESGRYFLHEHPKTATSWREPCIESLAADPTVMRTEIDQCAYGLVSKDQEGVAPAKKPTSFLTNSIGLVNSLNKKCARMSQACTFGRRKGSCRAALSSRTLQGSHDGNH